MSVIGKYGVLLATPNGWPQSLVNGEHYRTLIATGDDYQWMKTGYCHYFTSVELKELFHKDNVDILQIVGLEGVNSSRRVTNEFAEKHPEAWKNWVGIHNEICTEPFVVDASGHMMIIVSKK